ncbi:unnamed protein product [Urochloa humidicola]
MERVAETLAGNVKQLLGDEYRLLSSVGGEVTELRDDLATMNALLRMQSEADEAAADHFVRVWMNQLRELAYDAEDSVDLYKLRVKCGRPRAPGDVGAWLKRLFLTLVERHRLAGEVRALRARAIAIGERHARYGVNRDALRGSASFGAPVVGLRSTPALQHGSSNPDQSHTFVDIGGQAEALAKRVKVKDEDGERHLKVFSVVGFGGVGKTTLAKEVCRLVMEDFPYQATVSVSQAFDPNRDVKKLLEGILEQIVKPKQGNEKGVKEEEVIGVDKLGDYLSDKRYLIVIDDVWTIRAWEQIESKLPAAQSNRCGSRIIVTTRIETVAEACSPASVSGHYIHHMQPLNLEDAKKLFLRKAFGKMDAFCPKDLEHEMNMILKKCGGMPLAIVSVANILSGYTTP